MKKEKFSIDMTKDEMLRFYANKIVEEGISSCTKFETIVNLEDFGDEINLEKYKNKILDLLYKDERIADVTIDDNLYVYMVFYTDYCPYYYDEDDRYNEENIFNKTVQMRYLKTFADFYVERYIFEQPYITTRELINNFVNEIDDVNRVQRYKIANILKRNIIKSGFVEKYIENSKIYITPKNYKEFENALLKQCQKIEIENNNVRENEEEIE